jgi:hypothetical protein
VIGALSAASRRALKLAVQAVVALNPSGEQDLLGLWVLPSSHRSLRAYAGGGRRP